MLRASSTRLVRPATMVGLAGLKAPVTAAPSRGFASEQQLKQRMKAVGNIKKITSAMKMVAAAKLRRSQDALDLAREFAKSTTAAWPEPKMPETVDATKKHGIILMTSDRGLCGSVNSSIIRDVKGRVARMDPAKLAQTSIVAIGEKGRGGLERNFGQHFGLSVTEQGRLRRYTFKQASIVAHHINQLGLGDSTLIYNNFKSMLAFETRAVNWFSLETGVGDGSEFVTYEIEGDSDFFENFHLFRQAVRLFHFAAETETSELSTRMNAMGGSAKNAGEMLDRITLQYNRMRQSRITTELIEIISGSVALEDSN